MAIMIFTFVLVVLIYLFVSYVLYRIGQKFQIGSFWEYCIPFYNMFLITKCAGVPVWNFIGLFIPILNIYCTVNIWGNIAERLGKNYWLYGITILLFSIPTLILAFDTSSALVYEDEYEINDSREDESSYAEENLKASVTGVSAMNSIVNEEETAFSNSRSNYEGVDATTDVIDTDENPPIPEQAQIEAKPSEKRPYKVKRSFSSYMKKLPVLSGFFSKQINELVGVDIGTTTIKICALNNTKGFFVVNNVVLKTYEQDLLNDGHVVDPDFIGNELRMIFDENKIKSRNVACALSSYSVISKKISVPYLQDEELDKAISAEVENAIPFPLQDIYYSYYVLGMDAEKQSMMDVKIVAAKKEIVDGYIAAFNLADLALQIVDVDIFNVANFVEQIYSPREHSVVIVDIGASVTNIAILNGEEIEFTREILVGGKYLTNLIQKSSRISYHNAEEKKLSADSDIVYLFEDFIFNIASEINKTVRFYLATKPKENIGKIYVTGGSSLLPGLKEKIVEDTGIQVEVINPFLLTQSGDIKDETYQNLKEFMVVPLYLSTRITDIAI